MRKIITILILTSISYAGMSQFISLGVKGGVGFSEDNIYYEGKNQHIDGLRRLANFNGGLMLNLKISPKWYFHSEIIFEDKGNRVEEHIDSLYRKPHYYAAEQKERFHNYYIHFPQTIRFLIPFSTKEKVSFYVEAGGYFAYYIKSKWINQYYYNNTIETYEQQNDWADQGGGNLVTFHHFDWGITGGLGFLTRIWRGMLDINLKYDRMIQPFGSSNINSEKNYYDVIGITVGYTFPVLYKDFH
jgi:hypothetical protein